MKKKQVNLLKKVMRSPYTLLVIALYMGLSLYLSLTGDKNSLGWVGSFVGSLMVEVFGDIAWAVPLLLGYITIKELQKNKVRSEEQYRLVGLLLISATLMGSFSSGGILGNYFWETAESLFGEVVAFILLVIASAFCASPQKSQKLLLGMRRYLLNFISFGPRVGEQEEDDKNRKPRDEKLEPELEETSDNMGNGQSAGERGEPVIRSPAPRPMEERQQTEPEDPVTGQVRWGSERPSLELLENFDQTSHDTEEIRSTAERLNTALRQFQIKAKVEETVAGPMVATHFVSIQGGTKISEIERHLSDVGRHMGYPDDAVRLNLDMEGKEGKVAVEVPLRTRRNIGLRELMESTSDENASIQLPLRLGITTLGDAIRADLVEMPHLLVAGSTGSGKSIALNSMIVSLLYQASPQNLRLELIDPKMVEFSHFRGLPHLHGEVVTESDEAINVLNGLTDTMDQRYRLLNENNSRNITEYNAAKADIEMIPHIVLVIDELADLLMQEGKIAEEPIVRLAQKARAAGIHLIMATQRPTADVITGLIKTNVPARLAFRVSSNVDSRVILNQKGAESLQGKGDGLFLNPSAKGLLRLQSPMVNLDEIKRVTEFWKSR